MKQVLVRKYADFMDALGSDEPPLAARYTDERPDPYVGPEGGFGIDVGKLLAGFGPVRRDISQELLDRKRNEFRCMIRFLVRTRREHVPSVFDAENYGCPGCRFYLGFAAKLPAFNHYFTSTGFPGLYRGERFSPSPASSRRHAKELDGLEPAGKYLVFESIEHMTADADPDVVVFFCNPEILAGLVGAVRFATDRSEAVRSPFAAGCASVFGWPYKFAMRGEDTAVLGIFDPAARPYLVPGEMTIAMPFRLFVKILTTYDKSFLRADRMPPGIIKHAIPSWPEVKKRAGRFAKNLGSSSGTL
jgi:uncharacterized protein (DUF169 family)